jgi:hypothetical protein
MRAFLLFAFAFVFAACSPDPAQQLPLGEAPPPSVTLNAPAWLDYAGTTTIAASGDLAWGERVYFAASLTGPGRGACLPAIGGACLGLNGPVRVLGSALADASGVARFDVNAPPTLAVGTSVSLQAIVVRSLGGIDSLLSSPITRAIDDGPAEGTVLPQWTQVDFADDGYADGCVGGTKYVKSTTYPGARYVGVTLCSDDTYKIRLSNLLRGTFVSPGDWSGATEDQCEFVGGSFRSLPQGSAAVAPNTECWSRGNVGVAPTYEPVCSANRWVAPAHRCSISIPSGTSTGPIEGSTVASWTAFDFDDDGEAEGCAGGAKYIKSTPYAAARYVGVTLCSDDTYKIRLSDEIYGTFVSAGDWSGAAEDHCEYVGGTYRGAPQGSAAVAPNTECWSRGAAGTNPAYEATCAANRWVAPAHWCSISIPSGASTGPLEGSTVASWTAFDFADDGEAEGCAGGAKYIKSTPYATARYVGVTLCSDDTYKIRLSDEIYGTFVSAGDWSGAAEDHCEYVGGTYRGMPQGSSAVAANTECWSRGNLGSTPAYEATCSANRWVAPAHWCSISIPSGTSTGPIEGSSIRAWQRFDFADDGYRDGCAGGDKYIQSSGFTGAPYVGVTKCNNRTYKIWLGSTVYGTFYSAGDWSGTGEDHCEYVDGTFVSFPVPSVAATAGESCFSRGALGANPVFEASCAVNRWVPSVYDCGVLIP